MQRFRVWWNSFKTVAILLSFVINLVSLIVFLLLAMQLFKLKNGIVEPLVDGVHRDVVGLDEAVIVQSIDVEGQIPVRFNVPLAQATDLILTEDVPVAANATFTLPGGGGVINGRVDIVLPKNSVLPVNLDLSTTAETNVSARLSGELTTRVNETQLHDPLVELRDLLEPYVRVLDHLPDTWGEMPDFTLDALRGEGENLVAPSEDSQNPWPGFTTGAGQPARETQ
ncbi:MAG: hypothetical protein JXJ20_03210 [Anaerolineae bacterium]|nr:hypothetical protein [Anaerolineae bacterium]